MLARPGLGDFYVNRGDAVDCALQHAGSTTSAPRYTSVNTCAKISWACSHRQPWILLGLPLSCP